MKDRNECWNLVNMHLKTPYLVKHVLATEACMQSLAERLGEDKNIWGITGLVHDMDLDIVEADPARHGKVGAEILQKEGFDQAIVNAVLAHAGHKDPETKLEIALCAVDPTTGFIVAATLIRPDKKIGGVEVQNILKRMKEKRFAAGVSREQMKTAEKLGINFEEFLEICLSAMKGISEELGL